MFKLSGYFFKNLLLTGLPVADGELVTDFFLNIMGVVKPALLELNVYLKYVL